MVFGNCERHDPIYSEVYDLLWLQLCYNALTVDIPLKYFFEGNRKSINQEELTLSQTFIFT